MSQRLVVRSHFSHFHPLGGTRTPFSNCWRVAACLQAHRGSTLLASQLIACTSILTLRPSACPLPTRRWLPVWRQYAQQVCQLYSPGPVGMGTETWNHGNWISQGIRRYPLRKLILWQGYGDKLRQEDQSVLFLVLHLLHSSIEPSLHTNGQSSGLLLGRSLLP